MGLLAVLQALNLLWIINGVSFSWGYHGEVYTIGICVINFVLITLLVSLWQLNRKWPHFLFSLSFHYVAWIWLTMYCFPYLGELP